MSKYAPLKRYLERSSKEKIELTFDEIEEVLKDSLPNSAYKHKPWWANGGHSQADAWLDAGYKVDNVDQNKEEVTFVKSLESIEQQSKKVEKSKTKDRKSNEIKSNEIKSYNKITGGVALVSCTKSKRSHPSKPKDLYLPSSLFRKARMYSEKYQDDWYIISAKHHLLDPEGPEIEPYDETLKDFNKEQKKEWSKKVLEQLREKGLLDKKLVIHAGKEYYEELLPLLEKEGVEYKIPTEGLSFGKTLAWYNVWL